MAFEKIEEILKKGNITIYNENLANAYLNDIVSATEELSEKNIELLGILSNTYFKDIDDFTKTNTENTSQLLLLGSNIFAADKMLIEIVNTYVDTNSYEKNDTTIFIFCQHQFS